MKEVLKKIGRCIVRNGIRFYCKIIFRYKIIGKENIPKEGPVIICGNHKSYLDAQLMMVSTGRYTRFLAKAVLAEHFWLRILGKLFDVILVKRDAKDVTAIKESLKTLKDGQCLALFPEGTRNGLAKGEEVKDGAAFLALRSGAPVIPCGLKGGEWGNMKAYVVYGKPLDFSQYKGSKDKDVMEKVTKEIMDSILELTK